MKTLHFLIIGLLASTTLVSAQMPLISTEHNFNSAARLQAIADKQTALAAQSQGFHPLFNQSNIPLTPVAEAVTPEIQALADGLQDDPLRIFNYVHDHIRHVLYFGSKKGAELTFLEKSGNEFDQCALLVAMLRAAGYTNAVGTDRGVGYQFGWMLMPYDNPDGSHRDLHHWLQLTLTNSNFNTTSNYLNTLIYQDRGYPDDSAKFGTNTFAFQRIWVTLTTGTNTYYLDPAFKVSELTTGINLTNAMGFSSNALMSAAGGTASSTSVSGLSESALNGKLAAYTTNLLNYIQTNSPNAGVAQILGGWQITPSTNTALSSSLLFPTTNLNGYMPVLTWQNEPTNLMTTLQVTFAGTNYQWFFPQIQGQRLSLTFDSSGLAQLWQEDTLLAQHTTSGAPGNHTNVTFYINHPVGYWDVTNNNYIDTTYDDETITTSYLRTNSTYNIVYGFEPDWGWLQERQDKLDAYRQQGLADTSRQVVCETMNVMGLTYRLEYQNILQIEGAQANVLHQSFHHIGRLGQESGGGYYFDLFMINLGDITSGGYDVGNSNRLNNFLSQSSYYTSALEHSVVEQLQATNSLAVSTLNILETANTNGQTVYLATSANWQSGANIRGQLINYYNSDLTNYDTLIGYGDSVLLPKNGSNVIGGWNGYGYVDYSGGGEPATFIYGGYNGGQSSSSKATVNPGFTARYGLAQPRYKVFTPRATGADPVDMASGAFQVEHADLSLGQVEPRGVSYGRYYNSSRHFNSLAGMSAGWINNYYVNATTMCAPQASVGGTTPAQSAAIIAATVATLGIHNSLNPDPKNWMVTVLVAKWGADQLVNNGVSVVLGRDTIQFVKQPNGVFTPPANCTMTLALASSAYNLSERHGRTYKFNSTGLLTNILDQYSEPLTVTYNNSNWVSTVKDWKNRTLTFTYSGGQLTSVADNSSPSRSVSYGYSASGDLNSFTDAEGKTSTFAYDTNHQITAVQDAASRLVTTNFYDGFGHITKQFIQGDTTKTWGIFWSGWQNVEQNPAGSQRTFFYDDQTRFVGLQDQLGHLSQTFYDGQDHVVSTVSPLGETNQFIYDGNHNVLYAIDPLGLTNQFVYDNQNNLTRSVDARNVPSTFGYNAKFQLTGATNGAGDFISYVFSSTDGTLTSRTDSGGTTTYGYDGNGILNGITYPGSLGAESFANSFTGDPTNHTDARNNVTAYQYNKRRQLTATIAPTNLTTSVSYDANANPQAFTDARGNVTSNSWSATRRLLTTTLPTTAAGTPVVTNAYDSCDWLIRSVDPLGRPTQFTNDIADRLIAITDPLIRTASFGYDADNRRLTATNAALEVTTQQWDKRSQLTASADGAGHTALHTYDGAGNQTILTNRNGKKWQFQFDGANRLTNTITPLARTMSQSFNHQGLLATVKDAASQTTTYGYDAKGRLTSRADNVATTAFNYDANNNTTNISENGFTNAWAYDAYNRVSSSQDIYGNLIQYKYDAAGNLTNLIYPGGRNVFYSYDSNNHMTGVVDWSGRTTAIGYDLAGRITTITRPNGTYRTIAYDAAGQTTNILEQTAVGFPIALFRFNWNNAAEIQWEFAAPLPHTNAPPTRTMTYDDDNRLATFNGTGVTVDLDGNLTSAPLTNSTFAAYIYDARNRLLNAGGVTNAYDPAGNRVGITYGTNSVAYVVNPNAALSEVLMRVKNGVTNYYVYGPGLLYEVTETATVTNMLTYHYDYRGSTIALTDGNGNVTDRFEYSAYATLTYHAGANDTPFLFNGRYGVMTDPNSLLYMRARFYNPFLCRFINTDPSSFAGGLNFYAYANGNPISYLDPFGLGASGGWGDQFSGWIGQNIGNPLSSVSTTSTTANFAAYMAGSFVNGIGGLFHLGDGAAYAAYNSQNGWDVAIGITEDIQRAAGLASILAAPEAGAFGDVETTLNFSQKTASPFFSSEGTFAESTISDIATQLRDGTLTPADVPIQTVTIDGNTLIINTRSALALRQAGIPQSAWNLVDQTGNAEIVANITTRLANNGLTSAGTSTLRITGSGANASTYIGSGTIPLP
jgi:RHS repeat-associated protein